MTVALFLTVSMYGQYKYFTATKDFYIKANLKDDIFFSLSHDYKFLDDYDDTVKDINTKLSSFSGFDKIVKYEITNVYYNSICGTAFYYNKDMINLFKPHIKQGRWLSSDSKITEVVLDYSIFPEIMIGDTINFDNGITAKLVGRLEDIHIYPNFSNYGTPFTSNHLFEISNNSNQIYISKDSINEDIYNSININSPISNFFVCFKENATPTEKNEVISYLQFYGSCIDYDTIINNSNNYIDEWVRIAFPFPLFVITILTLSIICVSAVIIKRSMNEQSKYFLIGCTKKRSIATIISTLSILFSIPCIINIICAVFFPTFLRLSNQNNNYILDISCVYPVFIYLLFIVAILTIMPIAFYHKHSPLSFYRKNL